MLGNKEGDDITLMVDSVSAINLAKNSIAHGISKHIDIVVPIGLTAFKRNNTLEKCPSNQDWSILLKLYGTANGTHVGLDAPACWYDIYALCNKSQIATFYKNLLRIFIYVLLLLV